MQVEYINPFIDATLYVIESISMGSDGAEGLLKMKQAGAPTIAQDEKSCVVFGMPKEAIKIGAVDKITDINKITALSLSMIT